MTTIPPSINFRVFRRNSRNLILLWSEGGMSESQKESIRVYIHQISDTEESSREVFFRKFAPDNPEKFTKDVSGIVVPHAENKIDPKSRCMVRVVFGSGDDAIEIDKEVLPASASGAIESTSCPTTQAGVVVHLYAWDTEKGKWVPLPFKSIPGSTVIGMLPTGEVDK